MENEEEIAIPKLEKGRFISGSYSYTGPDNVLVTVTYKADERKARQDDSQPEEEIQEEEVEEEVQQDSVAEDEYEDDDSIVPTPPSLPAELARAFDFHKNKHLNEGNFNSKLDSFNILDI